MNDVRLIWQREKLINSCSELNSSGQMKVMIGNEERALVISFQGKKRQ